MTETSALLSLFFSAFLAAHFVTGTQSELGLGYLILHTDYSMVLLIVVASLGNTTGAIVNWFIGQGISNSIMRLEEFQASAHYWTIINWYEKYGQWTLFVQLGTIDW